ncbi:MAG: methyl-accepting chemotaxis protein [Candidatus Woesearchaeota archaeon]
MDKKKGSDNRNDLIIKIGAGFGVVLLLAMIIAVVGIIGLKNVDFRVEKAGDAKDLLHMGNKIRGEAKNFLIDGENTYYGGRDQLTLDYYDGWKDQINQKMIETKAKFKAQKDLDEINSQRAAFEEYDISMEKLVSSYESKKASQDSMDSAALSLMDVTEKIISDQENKFSSEISQGFSGSALSDRSKKLQDANTIKNYINVMRMNAMKMMLYGNSEYGDSWNEYYDLAVDATEKLKESFDDDLNKRQADDILDALEDYHEAGLSYIESDDDASQALQAATDAGDDFDLAAETLQISQENGMEKAQNSATMLMIIISVSALILGGVFAVYLSRNVNREVTNKSEIQKSFIHGIPDPVFHADKDLIITDCNNSFLEAMGYTRDEVVGKMSCADICKTPVCNTAQCTIKNCMDTKKPIVAETIASTKNGAKLDIRAGCGPLLDMDGNPVGGFEIIQDITKDKRMSRKLSEMANTFASSAEELSASAEEVNASMQQVSSTIQEVAKGAQTVSQKSGDAQTASKKTGESAESGSKSAVAVNDKMGTISKTTKDGAEKIRLLGEKSKEIGNIVETINNISEQTNLLALNAAIEAARAGDAGRGFAVVADEVRKLAEETGKATQQISDLITGIQGEIQSSVESMDLNTNQVDEGANAVQEALTSFQAIPGLVENVNKALDEMASVAQENAAGSEEVSSSVEQVSASMQQVSSSAQELTAAADELKKLARDLIDKKDDGLSDSGCSDSSCKDKDDREKELLEQKKKHEKELLEQKKKHEEEMRRIKEMKEKESGKK